MLQAILIENSLNNKSILKEVLITKTWKESGYTVHIIKIKEEKLPQLQKCLKGNESYIYLWTQDRDDATILFKDRRLTVPIPEVFAREPLHVLNSYIKPTVILVDNNKEYLATARKYVKGKMKYDVKCASDGKEALEAVFNLSGPAILLADYDLPDMHGLALIEEVERVTRFPVEPVLVTTRSDHKILSLSKQLGCDYFVKEKTPESPMNLGELYRSHIISAEVKLRERLRWMSKKMDSLTGLHDRESVMESWIREWKRAQRTKKPVSCIFIDVNDLKPINDKYGHTGGDKVLKAIVKAIKEKVRSQDLVIRYGGDEFAILLPETNKDGAMKVAKKVENSLKKMPVQVAKGATVRVSIALGISFWEAGATGKDALSALTMLYRRADKAMYDNKLAYKKAKGGTVR